MANHKSAKKRARQTIKRAAHNRSIKGTVRTWEKKLRAAIASKDTSAAQTLLRAFTKKTDKASQKGIIHANAASRKISRLSKQVSQLGN